MNKHQRKFNNTAVKMCQALISLLERHDFNDITIKELCEAAGVNRSTFYGHYSNMGELLDETRTYILLLFKEEYKRNNIHYEEIFQLPMEQRIPFILQDDCLIPYLKVFKENRNSFLIPALHPSTFITSSEYPELFHHVLLPRCVERGIADPDRVEYIMQFYLTGIHSIIFRWLRNGCQESYEELCQIIRECIFLIASSQQ